MRATAGREDHRADLREKTRTEEVANRSREEFWVSGGNQPTFEFASQAA